MTLGSPDSSTSPGSATPLPTESIIPPVEANEAGPTLEDTMGKHIQELRERNNSVGGRLCAEVGSGETKALIFTTPVRLPQDSSTYQMVVTMDGIKAIAISPDNREATEELQKAMADQIDISSKWGSQKDGGYESRPGSQKPVLKIGCLIISQDGAINYLDDLRQLRMALVGEPAPLVVTTLIEAERNTFQKLTTQQSAKDSGKLQLAAALKQI